MRHFCAISGLSSLDHPRPQGQRIFPFATNALPRFRRSHRIEVALTQQCQAPVPRKSPMRYQIEVAGGDRI
jgi:hypothetical protein